MRLCCSYRSSPAYRQYADEIRYSLGALGQVLQALEKYPDKLIIIEILDLEHAQIAYDKLKGLVTENGNIVIDCYKMRDYEILSEDSAFNRVMYHYPVTNYTEMRRVLYNHPWAITIGEPLTFDLMRVRQAVDNASKDFKIKIRVVPTLGRPSDWNMVSDKDNGLKHFWITPDTAHMFEEYIDVLDLYDEDIHREEALVDVFHKAYYSMPLGSIIKNLECAIPADMFNDDFMNHRLNCKQICMRDPGLCSYCSSFEHIATLTKPKTIGLVEFLKK